MNGREKNSEYFRQQKKLFPSKKRGVENVGAFFIAELFRLVFLLSFVKTSLTNKARLKCFI